MKIADVLDVLYGENSSEKDGALKSLQKNVNVVWKKHGDPAHVWRKDGWMGLEVFKEN